jgi:hypothetical protein
MVDTDQNSDEDSALRYVIEHPLKLSAASKRLVLRLVPYILLPGFLFFGSAKGAYEGGAKVFDSKRSKLRGWD